MCLYYTQWLTSALACTSHIAAMKATQSRSVYHTTHIVSWIILEVFYVRFTYYVTCSNSDYSL